MRASHYLTNQPPKHRRSVKVGDLSRVRLNRKERRAIKVAGGTVTKA
jgi:hypothetical protein